MSLNLGLLEASFQVTLFISVLVVIREEAFFNLVPSYQFAFRQQRGRREDDHSKLRIEYCFAKYDYKNRMVRRLDYPRRRAIK